MSNDQEVKTIEIQITANRLGAVILGAVLILTALLGYLALAGGNARAGGEASPGAASVALDSPRQYYLTATSYKGLGSADACASGYHFASLWEILDTSNLRYASNHPNAYVGEADQGSGPPTGSNGQPRYGWVRTGQNASTVNTAGVANCQNWTSEEANEYGTLVGLNPTWTSASNIFTWKVSTATCSTLQRVWCVED